MEDFFFYWDRFMRIGALISIAISIFIILYYEFKVQKIKDYKEKYDYINLHEIKYFWVAIITFILAIALFINSISTQAMVAKSFHWFYVRIFMTVSFSIISYFLFYGMIRVFYPGNVEKRLRKLREKPRISPAGNEMRKLGEAEEDAHLEASQIEDEAFHSIDYDVWIDEKTGFKKIEKYYNYQHAEECPECGYYTMKIKLEEVEKEPTDKERGRLLQHYECSYCEHKEIHEVKIAKITYNPALNPA